MVIYYSSDVLYLVLLLRLMSASREFSPNKGLRLITYCDWENKLSQI